ncbi:MAG: DUF4349 domain-containing protein [Chloroflexi bacterium]|nr:DUF4349 domain-containing protein [Chloroflexota bacterium]
MKLQFSPRYSLSIVVVLTMTFAFAFAIACSGGGSDSDDSFAFLAEVERGSDESGFGRPGAPGASAAAATPAPAATAAPAAAFAQESVQKSAGDSSGESRDSSNSFGVVTTGTSGGSASLENEIAAATEGRVIVRTADLGINVDSITESLDDISKMAVAAGGWVVSSVQSRQFQGSISIRVPADRFDDVIEQLKDLAAKVNFVTTRSEDFTEEFTDVTARAQTLRDTLGALRTLYDRADSVEDAITIQKEITNVQSDLESLEARLTFLSQSSAFSFISVALESVPIELDIDAGDDIAAAVGHRVTYRAKFTPPEDMEDFVVTWNFGDGSREQSTDRIAPTGNGEEVITAPIIHVFDRDEDSPFIVTVELRGTGDAGIAEGDDTLVTTVSRLPVIEVFAGENQIVEAGSEVDLSASFNRPEGVSEISYSWNFGDGSAPVEGNFADSDTAVQVDTTHTYSNFRPNPYVVSLTVTGQTEVGEVEVTGELLVFVRETIGVKAADLDAGSTVRDAVRTLQSVGVFLAKAGLWLLILSPAWLIGGAVVFILIRRRSAIRIPRRSAD